jgi:hypothetical protein
VNFPKSTRSGLEEVCVSDNRRFAAVFSTSGGVDWSIGVVTTGGALAVVSL